MNEVLLETHALTKEYKHSKALDNVSVRIKRGRLYGFVGQNGAGKTTFLRLATGLSFPTSGELELFGQRGERNLSKARTKVGSLIETPALYPNMSARENLQMQQLGSSNTGKRAIDEALKAVGLKDTGKKKSRDFSLGMKQRLAIAVALINQPELLLLDEPINGLDPISIVEVRELLQNLCLVKGITILISSHILTELYQLATDYIFIDKGQIIEEITHDDLNEKCRNYISIKTNDPHLAASVLEQELGTKNYSMAPDNCIQLYDHLDAVEAVSAALTKAGLVLSKITVEGESLEHYFVNLVGGDIHA